MAGIKDIMEIERGRHNPGEYGKIHIFQEGSFYRAYQFSAWLCTMYMKDFKVTHRQMKGIDESVCFVGFPVTSLEKWVPEGAKTEQIAEKHQCIVLSIPVRDEDGSQMMQQYEEWKSSLPLTEAKEKDMAKTENKSNHSEPNRLTLFSIAQQVLAYQIESKSPIECMLFLSEIKSNLAKII
ncbi:MAG: hypothetical protein ACI3X4_08260 [Bacteroidaceae bacterium]